MHSYNTSPQNNQQQASEKEDISTKKKEGASMSNISSHNIVTVPIPKTHMVDEYEPGKLRDSAGIKYSEVSKNFSQGSGDRKNSRFKLNELTKGPLSVLEEEELRIRDEVDRRVQEELTRLSETAKKEGYEAGFEAGKAQATQQTLDAAKPMVENFQAMITEFDSQREMIFKANEDLIGKMVYWIAKMVTLKELKEDQDYTRRLILNLLDRIGTRENIKIFVGMQVYSAAEKLKQDLAQSLGQLKNISIELDSTITDLGCRLETDFCEVDARIATQLENCGETFDVEKSKA